jgi:hypothetical protein
VWIGGPDPGSLNDIRALRESEFADGVSGIKIFHVFSAGFSSFFLSIK